MILLKAKSHIMTATKRISDASDFVGQGITSQLDTIGCSDIYPAHKDDECSAGTYYQGIREDTQH